MRKYSRKIFKFIIDDNNFITNDRCYDDVVVDFIRDFSSIGIDYISKDEGIISYINITDTISELYVRDEDGSIEVIYDLLKKYFTEVVMSDCTDEILFNNELVKRIDDSEELSESRKILFEKFRREMTSVDDVLDKISMKGIDYLDDIDKDILKS